MIRSYLTRIASYILSSQRNPFVWATADNSPRTITGKPAAIRTAADLDRALAARKALRPAQKGWRTRKGAAA